MRIYPEDDAPMTHVVWGYEDDTDYPGPDAPWDEYPDVGQYTSEDLEFLDRARASEVDDADAYR